jgi:hypothetical protein
MGAVTGGEQERVPIGGVGDVLLMCSASMSVTGSGAGTVRQSSIFEPRSRNGFESFWFTTTRPNVTSRRSMFRSQIRNPIASSTEAPTTRP